LFKKELLGEEMQANLHYGIYRGICYDNNDPTKKNRIKLQVPQILGTSVTDWAYPCLPVTDNANHPDHIAHTAAQVAALLVNHTDTITTSSVNDGGTGSSSHSHTVTLNAKHTGTATGTLKHPHQTTVSTTNLWNESSAVYNDATSTYEHTPHRTVPRNGQGVWVMFEGGDANFPVWMGVF
jgi:hypothetical protein